MTTAGEFVYTVPLTAFSALFRAVDSSLHADLADTLRTEIHADIARRRAAGRAVGTTMGPEDGGVSSALVGGDLVFTVSEDTRATPFSSRRPVSPRRSVESFRDVTVSENRWPGNGRGLATSVNAVLAAAPRLAVAYGGASDELRDRRRRAVTS